MADPADLQRLLGDLARVGVIESIDAAEGTARVRLGELVSGDLPFLVGRAGAIRTWCAPSLGEQVLVLALEADLAAGVILGSINSDARPAPATGSEARVVFDDGASISYDPEARHLSLDLPDRATIDATSIRLMGQLRIDGDVEITGKVTVSDDVVAAGTSLKDHVHSKVQAGGALSGPPA